MSGHRPAASPPAPSREAAVDRSGRLRLDREVDRSAAAADAAAAAVEQRDADAVAAARGDDRLLRFVEIQPAVKRPTSFAESGNRS